MIEPSNNIASDIGGRSSPTVNEQSVSSESIVNATAAETIEANTLDTAITDTSIVVDAAIVNTVTAGNAVNNSPLFSQILQNNSQIQFPKKNQAIILNTVEGIPIKSYITALGKTVGPKNIRFASRISNNRICVYLASKECVEKFMLDHAGVSIGDVYVTARRLITPSTRVILSNVSPSIPHNIIREALIKAGLKVISPVTFVGAGFGLSEYSHVYSFRRQVFIIQDEHYSLPSSLVIDFEEDKFRIFISDDVPKCFLCHNPGHISRNCPTTQKNTSIATETRLDSNTSTEDTPTKFISPSSNVIPITPKNTQPAVGE